MLNISLSYLRAQITTLGRMLGECRWLYNVNPRNATKACSRCGCIIEISLSERKFNCPHCGLSLPRDVNTAINILRLGLPISVSGGLSPLEASERSRHKEYLLKMRKEEFGEG
jgi:transposase